MKKFVLQAASVALLATSALVFSGCGKKDASDGKTYTYRDISTNPQTWNPTDWQNSSESIILDYTTVGLFSFVPTEDRNGYEIIPEMASKMAEDVTSQYAGKAPYGVPADATSGWAWKVTLNKNIKWEDGTKISAKDVEYTIKQFIAPEMKNYRGSSFHSDSLPLANAKNYYAGTTRYDDVLADGAYADVADSDMYISLSAVCKFFGDGSIDVYASGDYADYFTVDGVDYYAKLQELVGTEYKAVTPEIKDALLAISKSFGDNNPEAYKEYCFTKTELEPTPWENVGFIKNDDYTFTLVLAKQMSSFDFYYNSGSLILVKEDLYESLKKPQGSIVKSTYGTSVANYQSYGPYKLADFQEGKSISFVKNENWYGYTDGKHKGQYQTTGIDLQFLTDHATILNLFLQGNLDSVSLAATDMAKYGNSEFRVATPRSYTWKFSFNSDRKSLTRENTAGINHSILANFNFRHAVSLSLNRQEWVDVTNPASDAGYGLLNYLYVAEPDTGALYRDSEPAKQTLLKFYNASSLADITGYDLVEAKKLFQQAYDEEVAAGYLKPTDRIELEYHCYSASEGNMRRVNFLQDALNKATVGTNLEGKIAIKQVTDQNYYDNMKTGNVDIAFTSWGGSSFDPYGVLWCYADLSAKHEYGSHPDVETCTVTIEGKEVTKTLTDWYTALTGGEYSAASYDVKNTILAACEYQLLSSYDKIPVEYDNVLSLDSQRVIEFSDHYINSLVGNGGLRFMTYSMDDTEWAAYCAEQNNQLQY